MVESFDIPVTYKEQELSFHSRLRIYGYSYKIEVNVFGEQIMFEQDEERKYRAVLSEEQIQKNIKFDIDLLKAIATVMESVREKE